jgi:hypothetical protein
METLKKEQQDRKPYEPPAVVYEATLDVRAGTPTPLTDPLDLFSSGK